MKSRDQACTRVLGDARNNRIGFVITTVDRDNLLESVIASCNRYLADPCEMIVVDQKPSSSKRQRTPNYVEVPFNCGLSYSRNRGVQYAKKLGCDYVVMMADSIELTAPVAELYEVVQKMREEKYDIIGFPLEGRVGWEGNIELIPEKCFILDFVKKIRTHDLIIQPCEICRNFFVAKTETLLNVSWDEELKMREHEDFFWRCKINKVRVGFTNKYAGKYIGVKTEQYNNLRSINLEKGLKTLQQKYNIAGWIEFRHREYNKEPIDYMAKWRGAIKAMLGA